VRPLSLDLSEAVYGYRWMVQWWYVAGWWLGSGGRIWWLAPMMIDQTTTRITAVISIPLFSYSQLEFRA